MVVEFVGGGGYAKMAARGGREVEADGCEFLGFGRGGICGGG